MAGFDIAVLATQAMIVLTALTVLVLVLAVLLDGLVSRVPKVITDALLIAMSMELCILAIFVGVCSFDLSAFPYLKKIFYGL